MTSLGHAENLNEAIWKVVTEPMKKWCEAEYKWLKSAGYEINKEGRGDDGYFVIRNPRTHRYVYVTHSCYYSHIHTNNCKSGSIRKKHDDLKKVDFVKMLDTPFNEEYARARSARDRLNSSEALMKYDNLKSYEKRIKWAEDDVEEIQKQINDLQKKLIRFTENKVQARIKYNEYRKELGLA